MIRAALTLLIWLAISGKVYSMPLASVLDHGLSINDMWAFMPQDDYRYAELGYDHSTWPTKNLTDAWPDAGYPASGNVIWLRKELRFDLPLDYARAARLGLRFGPVRQAADVYAGGIKLGSIGQIDDQRLPDFRKVNVWRIPAEAITTDGRLVIAVRIWAEPLRMSDRGARFSEYSQVLGDYVSLKRELRGSKLPALFISFVLLLFAIFAFYLYRRSHALRDYFWFGVVTLGTSVFTLIFHDWRELLGWSVQLSERLLFLSFVGLVLGGQRLLWSLLMAPFPRWLTIYHLITLGACLVIVLQPSLPLLLGVRDIFWFVFLWSVPAVVALVWEKLRAGVAESRVVAVAVILFLVLGWHDMVRELFSYHSAWATLYPYGFLVLAAMMAILIANRFGARIEILEAAVAVKVAELEDINGRLRSLSERDTLTQLDNRRGLEEKAQSLLARPADVNKAPVFVLLDIDHFKTLNDQHGHQVGDQVLIEFSERLRAFCRSHDLVGRWGGEEFMLILAGLEQASARARVNELHSLIESRPFYCEADSAPPLYLDVTATIGVAFYRSSDTFDTVLSRADRALYKGKDLGRNQIVCID